MAILCLGLSAAIQASAETAQLRIAQQFGVSYLPLIVAKERGLIEKAAKKAGIPALGWHIYVNRNQLETANVFAGLLVVIAIGLIVEGLLFRTIASRTVERWGQQH